MVKINHFSYWFQIFLLATLLLPIQIADGTPMTIPTASITVDGNPDDWAGLTPVSIDSQPQAAIKKIFLAVKDNKLYFFFELWSRPDTSGNIGYRLWFDNDKNGIISDNPVDRQISVAFDTSRGTWYIWLQKQDGTRVSAQETTEVKGNYIEGSVALDLFGVENSFKLSSGTHSERSREMYYQGPTVDLALSNEKDGTIIAPVSANIVIDGNPADWSGIKPIMSDPEGDGANVWGSDLKALYAYKDSSFLYLMLEVYNNPDGTRERVQYIFEISNTVDSPFLKWDYQPGGDAQGGTWLWDLTEYDTRVNYKNPNPYGLTMPIPGAEAMGRAVFEMKVPLFLIGNPENMIIRARTVVGEDRWADDMPGAKFITNPSLLKKTAETKTSTPLPTPFVIINKPKDRDTVPWRYMVEGSSSAIQNSGLNLYILVWNIESNGPWWVQPVSTFSDGSFQSNAYFGRDPKIFPDDKGSSYKLIAIITKQILKEQTFNKLPDHAAKSKEITVTRESDTTAGAPESKEYRNQFSEGLNYVVFPLLVSLVVSGIVLFFDIRQKNKRLKNDLKTRHWFGYYSALIGHFVIGTIFVIISFIVFFKELPVSFDEGKFFFTIPIFYLSASSFILISGLILSKPITKLNGLHLLISLLMGIFTIFIIFADPQKSPPVLFPILLLISSGISIWYDRVAIVGLESIQESISVEKSKEKSILEPDIKRGYAVLPNNDIKFGIRLTNNTGYTITDVDTILDFTEELFKLKKSKIQRIGNIPPETARTAAYILKPLGCIHNENINAIISYTDATGKKHALHMRPKEVHCVCPFLKEKPLSEGEYSRLAASSEFVQEGISFKGISVEELAKFMGETCRHMLYKVREYDLEDKKVIYLSGESLGEKAYYLLTAVIQEYKGLTQVLLRAHSDKKYGLNGFMNEMADSIRHLVGSVQSAKEIGIIENTQVINIIDSVVQRTSFEMGEGGNAQVNIKDSMVRRTKIGKSKE